jgi:hypothetical protein
MRQHEDAGPMTPEKAIKLKAHGYIMRMHNAGVPWEHSNVAALIMAIELKNQYKKLYERFEWAISSDAWDNAIKSFEALEEGIKGFLPLPREERVKNLTARIEQAFEDAETISHFKAKVLTLIKQSKDI